MRYNKLVRDRIPEIIRKNGGRAKFYRASLKQFTKSLKKKLRKEVEEFCRATKMADKMEEIADILEVIDAICEVFKWPKMAVRQMKLVKARKKGAYKLRIILKEA